MKRRCLLGLAALVVAGQLVACGASASLADPAPCPTTTPLPTSAATPRVVQGRSYFNALQQRFDRLQDLWTRFKLAYPDRSFRRDSAFRTDVARFIDDSACTAISIRQMESPSPTLEQSKAQMNEALNAYLSHLQAGRDAVRSRNVTDYHTFWDGLDAKFEAVRASFARR